MPIALLSAVLLAAGLVQAEPLAPGRRALAVRVVDLIIMTRYREAFSLADSAAQRGDATFRMLKLMGIGLRDMDFETVVDSVEFDSTFAQALREVQDLRARSGDGDAYALTVLGFVQAARSGRDLREGRYAGAVKAGREALESMRAAVSADSSFADPDYFLGLYDFAMADLRKRLWWVLFWLPGDRERGIARLERCRDSSLFAGSAATLSLLDAYVHEERFAEARAVLHDLQARFGGSRFVLWGEARLEEARGEAARAADVYRRLAESYTGEEYGAFNAAACRYQQARLLAEAGQNVAALEACRLVTHACALVAHEGVCGDARKLLRRLESSD